MPKGIYERKPRGTDNGDSAPRRGPGRPRRELQPLDWRNTSAAERIELDEHGSPVLDDAPEKLIERSPIDETAPWGEIAVVPAEEAPLRPDKKGVYRKLAELLLDKLVDGADRRFVVTVAFDDKTRAVKAAKVVGLIFARLRGKDAVEVWTAEDRHTGGWRLCIRRAGEWK